MDLTQADETQIGDVFFELFVKEPDSNISISDRFRVKLYSVTCMTDESSYSYISGAETLRIDFKLEQSPDMAVERQITASVLDSERNAYTGGTSFANFP